MVGNTNEQPDALSLQQTEPGAAHMDTMHDGAEHVNDKPEGARVGWLLRETRYPFGTPWFRVRQDRIQLAGNGEILYTYIQARPAVFVVPITADGQMLLIRQYRYPIDEWAVELPAGGSNDRQDMALEDVAREELREELGASCTELLLAGTFNPVLARSSQVNYAFLALGVTLDGPPALEPTELIEPYPLPVAEAVTLAESGRMVDGQAALTILLCARLLRERGLLR